MSLEENSLRIRIEILERWLVELPEHKIQNEKQLELCYTRLEQMKQKKDTENEK